MVQQQAAIDDTSNSMRNHDETHFENHLIETIKKITINHH